MSKTKIFIVLLLLIVFVFIYFKNVKNINSVEISDCVGETKDFLIWYKNNFDSISDAQDSLIDFDTYYRPKYDKVDTYINVLASSGFFTEEYISNFKNDIIKAMDQLLEFKQNDGPPEGFDYDFFFGHEYDSYLTMIPDSISVESIRKTKELKIVKVAGYQLYNLDNSCKLLFNGTEDNKYFK